jgi:REP element-mobilizing transposase RayT
MFIDLLQESCAMWNLRIAAYCLMTNHYHLLVQTPEGNIARCMRHINGVYTQRFNRAHSCDGQLFRGRYKSILVDGDNYLLELVRYIHRNPIEAGLTLELNGYPWSSHKGYLSVAAKWNWLNKEFIFSLLTSDRRQWIKQYRKFVSTVCAEEISAILDRKKWPSVMGAESFVDWVKGKYYRLAADPDVPQAKELAPSADMIIAAVCDFYGVGEYDIYQSRRGHFNEARNMAVFLVRKLRGDKLNLVGQRFGMEKYSSVSSIIGRLNIRMRQDRNLRIRMGHITKEIIKSQKKT